MVNLRMGRKRLGNAAKQRHTITIDPEVVERVSEFGSARGIDGLSGSIERLVRLALVVDLIGFSKLLRCLEKRKPRRDAGAVTKLEKKRRATGKNGSLVAPATR